MNRSLSLILSEVDLDGCGEYWSMYLVAYPSAV